MKDKDIVVSMDVEPRKEVVSYNLREMDTDKVEYQEFVIRFRVFKDTRKYESKDYVEQAIRLLKEFLEEVEQTNKG